MRGFGRRMTGGYLGLVLVLALGLGPHAQAAKFTHASSGAIEVYSSDTPDNTRRFVAELLEVRRQIQELVAPVPLPNLRMQILVFSRLKDYEEFLPQKPEWDKQRTTISGFTSNEFALVAAVVKEGQGYEFGRESVRYFYASFLMHAALPDAPIWIKVGVPEFLATTDYRGDSLFIGADFMDHRANVRASKLLPLAELMDDGAMKKFHGVAKHDNALYHESWALWHRWLTDPEPKRREQVRRLFAAIRAGQKGGLETVVASFGETAEAIDAERRSPARGRSFSVVEANKDAAALVRDFSFAPATELDGRFGLALLAASRKQGPADLGYDLYRIAQTEPQSPRVPEGLAILAMGEGDSGAAEARWEKAREMGTTNPYAYLVAAREALARRPFSLAPRAQLPEAKCAELRQIISRCVELDPGSVEGQFYRILVEAFAPEPEAATVDAVAQSRVLLLRPQGEVYLAIARWRLGQRDEALAILTALREDLRIDGTTRRHIDVLTEAIRKETAAKG